MLVIRESDKMVATKGHKFSVFFGSEAVFFQTLPHTHVCGGGGFLAWGLLNKYKL
jgi:hypothetical protein